MQPRSVPTFKRALSRVIEYECKKPGEFAWWLTCLHIEHWIAYGNKKDESSRDDRPESASGNSGEG